MKFWKLPFWVSLTNVDPHVAAAIREAHCYQQGFAHGEQLGAARAFQSVEEIVRARRGGQLGSMDEITQDDIDEARKVRVH